MSMEFIRPTSLNSIPNSIQIDEEFSETIGAEVSAFSHQCAGISRSKSQQENVQFNHVYHHIKFEPNRVINDRMHANVKTLLFGVFFVFCCFLFFVLLLLLLLLLLFVCLFVF